MKKLKVQENNESRRFGFTAITFLILQLFYRIWYHVTKELKANNEKAASDAKHAVSVSW